MIKFPSTKQMNFNYLLIKKQLKHNFKFIDNIKTIFSIMCLMLSIWIYWYFINVSSTKWYFIKNERNKLSDIKFKNEIIKIDVRKIEWSINNTLTYNSSNTLTWKVITLNSNTELTMR